MSPSIIGTFTLNLSFILYCIVYLPQIWHNRKMTHIQDLSTSMHFMLYLAYLFDLFYGYAYGLQWQYKVVSWIGLLLLIIQHLQLLHWNKNNQIKKIYSVFLLISMAMLCYFFLYLKTALSPETTALIGFFSRGLFIFYSLPQILKNKSHAISLQFIYLNLILAFLDLISAWCLDWGWPNRLSAPIILGMMLILLQQKFAVTRLKFHKISPSV